MWPLFVELIKNAQKNFLNNNADWEILIHYAASQNKSQKQLELLVHHLYQNVKDNQVAVEQLITDIVTTFLILAKPSAKDYQSLVEMLILIGIHKTDVDSQSHLQNLIKDILALRFNQIKTNEQEKKEFIQFLNKVDPKNSYFSEIKKALSQKTIIILPTTILFTPFSEEKGHSYLQLISHLVTLKKNNNLSNKDIDHVLESKFFFGNNTTIDQAKKFAEFVLQQSFIQENQAICDLLIDKIAKRVNLKNYMQIVDHLIEKKPDKVGRFLEVTFSIVADEKLKDADSALQFIQFADEIKTKLKDLPTVLDESVKKTIEKQLGKRSLKLIQKNLQQIEALEQKIAQLEIPKVIVDQAKLLGEEFAKKVNQEQERLLNDKSNLYFSTNVKAKFYNTKVKDFSQLKQDFRETGNRFKAELTEKYIPYKKDIENLVNEVNVEFKRQISSLKNERITLSKKVNEFTEKETNLIKEISKISEEIKTAEDAKSVAQNNLNNLFKGGKEQQGFLDFLKNDMPKYITRNLKDIDKNLKTNRRAQQFAGIRYTISESVILRALVLFRVPKTEKVQQQLAKLKDQENEFIRQKAAFEQMGIQINRLSIIEDPTSESGQLTFSQSKNSLEQLYVNRSELTAYLQEIEENQISYAENMKKFNALNERKLSLENEIKTIVQDKEKLVMQLQELPTKLNDLKNAYQKLPEAKIDFSQHLELVDSLYQYIANGDLAGTELLLKNARNWDISYGNTPLQLALLLGHIEIAKFFIEQGANVNPSCLSEQNTPLFLAYQGLANANEENKNRFIEVINALEAKGAEFLSDEIGEEKNTILHLAVKNGDIERAQQWLEEKRGLITKITGLFNPADLPINKQNAQGETALHLAVKANNSVMVNYLLEQGADKTIKNKALQTPFELLKEMLPLPKETATKKEVAEASIKIDQLSAWLEEISGSNFSEDSEREKWINIFKKASFKHQWELVNAQDKNGDTLLHVAVKRKDLESVDLLVKHNPDMMIKNWMGQTVLGLADANWQNKADTWEYFFKVELPRDIAGAETSKPTEQKIYESIRNCSSRQDYSYKSSIFVFNGISKELGRVLTEYESLLSDKVNADNARFLVVVKKIFTENPELIEKYKNAYNFINQGIETPEQLARLKEFLLSKSQIANMLKDSGVLLAHEINAENVQFVVELKKQFEENQKSIKNHETAYQQQLAELKGFLLNRREIVQISEATRELLVSVKEKIAKTKIEAKRAPWCENEAGNNLFHQYTKKGEIKLLDKNLTIWGQHDSGRLEKMINQTNISGYTPLHLAIAFAASGVPQDQAASLKMVELLVEKGADINIKDIGEPALNIAIKVDFFKEGSLPIFDYLLSKEANVNSKDSQGETALHILARRTDEAAVYMVKKLLEQVGSKIDVPNNKGETALQIAQQCGNRSFIGLCEKNQKLSKVGWAKTTFFAQVSSEARPTPVKKLGIDQPFIVDDSTDDFKNFRALRNKKRAQEQQERKEEQKQPETNEATITPTSKVLHQ